MSEFEFQYRWSEVASDWTTAVDKLEARDQALEQFIADFDCAGGGVASWDLTFTTTLSQQYEQTVDFVVPFAMPLPADYHFTIGAGSGDSGSIGYIFLEMNTIPIRRPDGIEVYNAFDSYTADTDGGFDTIDGLFVGYNGVLLAGDVITFDYSPEPFDQIWTDVTMRLTISGNHPDQTVLFP